MTKLWYVGDSILSPTLQIVASNLSLELIDSSIPDATMEQTWGDQIQVEQFFRQNRNKRKQELAHVVLFLNQADYDSEALIWQILPRTTEDAKIILIVTPANAPAAEGLTAHWQGDRFKLIAVDNLEEVADLLQAALG